MDIVPILSAIVLTATLATLILGVLSYVAFRARERRRPTTETRRAESRRFLVRYTLDAPEEAAKPL